MTWINHFLLYALRSNKYTTIAVPGKFHRISRRSKCNCLQDQANFHRSRAWQIIQFLILQGWPQSKKFVLMCVPIGQTGHLMSYVSWTNSMEIGFDLPSFNMIRGLCSSEHQQVKWVTMSYVSYKWTSFTAICEGICRRPSIPMITEFCWIKLNHYGFQTTPLKWFNSYLKIM